MPDVPSVATDLGTLTAAVDDMAGTMTVACFTGVVPCATSTSGGGGGGAGGIEHVDVGRGGSAATIGVCRE